MLFQYLHDFYLKNANLFNMNTRNNFQFVAQWVLILGASFFFLQSCDPEPIQGCTDPASLNFDATAEEDDGSCEYEADKFVGSFSGDLVCSSGSITEVLVVDVLEDATTGTDSVALSLSTSIFSGLAGVGVVSGDEMTISVNADSVAIEFNGLMNEADIVMNGVMTLSADESNISGSTSLMANSTATGSTIINSDDCSYSGDRQ